ncbi:hypothetical protein PN836_014375 [Ningiella sp. W23]|uniref:hypothetical protein n=1 Tax=Ningiella sp. W23 TaxID=3023715 RepID=UPI003756B656
MKHIQETLQIDPIFYSNVISKISAGILLSILLLMVSGSFSSHASELSTTDYIADTSAEDCPADVECIEAPGVRPDPSFNPCIGGCGGGGGGSGGGGTNPGGGVGAPPPISPAEQCIVNVERNHASVISQISQTRTIALFACSVSGLTAGALAAMFTGGVGAVPAGVLVGGACVAFVEQAAAQAVERADIKKAEDAAKCD